jgi:MFS family permease
MALGTRVVIFVAFLDLFMLFPVIAVYGQSLGATGAMVGIIVAAYSATNLIGNLGAGAILDRWGRQRPLLVGLLATALALVGYTLAKTPLQLLAARAIHGLSAAVLNPGAFTILGDSVHPDQRARAMGLSGAFIAVAAVVGPPVAGALRDSKGAEAVFTLVAALLLCAFIVFWLISRKWTVAATKSQAPSRVAFWRRPHLICSYLAVLVLTVGLGTLVTHLPIVMAARSETAMRTGLTFTAFALAAMISMASPLNRISDRFGRLRPLMIGLGLTAVGMLTLWVLTNFLSSLLGMAVFGLGFGILFPAMATIVAEAVVWHQRGKAFGVFYAVFSLGVIIGSVASGFITEHLGDTSLLPFLVSAVAALAAIPAIGSLWSLSR